MSRVTLEGHHLPSGTVVYIFRKVKPRKGTKLPLLQGEWLGPATVVGHEGSSVWCSYRGACTKCASEHVRRASDEEMLAFHAIPEDDQDLMKKLFDGKVSDLSWSDFADVQAKTRSALHEPHAPARLPPEGRVGEEVIPPIGSTQIPPTATDNEEPPAVPDLDDDEDLRDEEMPELSFPPREQSAPRGRGSARAGAETRSRSRTPARNENDPTPAGPEDTAEEAAVVNKVERLFASLSNEVPELASEKTSALKISEVLAATARREKPWSKIRPEERHLYVEAARDQWQKWVDNDAVQVIPPGEAAKIRKELEKRNEGDRIIQMRHMFTDKNDGKRSDSNPLPIKANDRLIVPGFKDPDLTDLRRDAPTTHSSSTFSRAWTRRRAAALSSSLMGCSSVLKRRRCVSSSSRVISSKR